MFSPHNEKAGILIIDDDELVRGLLFDLLEQAYECRSVGSAEAALSELNRKTFDLIISDIDMGGMSGLELVPHVHSLSPDSVVVMISGHHEIETAIQAMRAGAFDYICKPLDIIHVEAAVARALDHSRLLKDKRRYKEQLETLLQQRTAEVDRLAYYDTVTQLPNRSLFEDRLAQAVSVAKAENQTLGVLFISFDQYKKVNDTLGHDSGDYVLREFAQRLKSCLAETDTVARFGSDEFAVLQTGVQDANEIVETIGSVSKVLKFAFDVEEQELFATASVGVSLFPLDGEDPQTLMKNAGAAWTLSRPLPYCPIAHWED